jgi:hypothetical protein
MKHYPILVIFFMLSLIGQGQVLTTGEVYDFEVGDVFQSTRTISWGPPTTTTETIVGKTLYTNGDSVSYSIHRTTYTPPSGPGLPPTFSDQIISKTYFSLDDPAWQWEIQYDTLYTNPGMCGMAVWEITTGDSFGPNYGYSRLIQGCGGPYSHSFSDQTFQWQNEDLTYFNKGSVECGTFQSNPVGISETGEQRISLSIHPVPSSDQVTVQLAGLDARLYGEMDLSVTDAQGRALKHMIVHASQIAGLQLNIHDLPAGTFVLNLTIEGRVVGRCRLIKI